MNMKIIRAKKREEKYIYIMEFIISNNILLRLLLIIECMARGSRMFRARHNGGRVRVRVGPYSVYERTRHNNYVGPLFVRRPRARFAARGAKSHLRCMFTAPMKFAAQIFLFDLTLP